MLSLGRLAVTAGDLDIELWLSDLDSSQPVSGKPLGKPEEGAGSRVTYPLSSREFAQQFENALGGLKSHFRGGTDRLSG